MKRKKGYKNRTGRMKMSKDERGRKKENEKIKLN